MSTVNFKYDNGDLVECVLTGFKGMIDQRSECLNGCLRYSVTSKVDPKTGDFKGFWIDEGQLKKRGNGLNASPKTAVKKTKTGAPMSPSR